MGREKLWAWISMPIMWWAKPSDVPILEQTAWQRGKASVAANARSHPGYQFLLSVLPGGLTAVAASNLVLGFLVAAAGYCLVPFLWAVAVAAHAPVVQRNEARDQIQAERIDSADTQRLLNEQIREAQLMARTQELQAKITASKLRAVQEIPTLIERVPDPLEGYSGARNQVLWKLQEWAEETVPALREGGYPELAAQFESDGDQGDSVKETLRANYERRLKLLTPVPNLKLVE